MKIDLIKIVKMLKNNVKKIAAITVFTTTIAIIYCIFATPIYTARIIINPPKLTDAGAHFTSLLSGLNNFDFEGGGGLLNQLSDIDKAVEMLNTNIVKNYVIREFNLKEYYKIKVDELVRRKLSIHVNFVPDYKSGFLEIQVSDKEPKLSAAIANYYPRALGRLISDIAYTSTNNKLKFYQEQLGIARNALNISENNFKNFSKEHGILAGKQVEVITGIVTQLQSQLILNRIRLQELSSDASPSNVEYQQVRATMLGIEKQLEDLNKGQDNKSNMKIPANLAPEYARQYINLMQDLNLRETIFRLIEKQHEAAKIDTLSELTPTVIQVIDPAEIPTFKSKPQRLRIILSVLILSIIFSIFYFILRNYKNIFLEH